ncbi:MAG: HDIG domain-containing metalloprotein [Bdellovibrionota bacterium]
MSPAEKPAKTRRTRRASSPKEADPAPALPVPSGRLARILLLAVLALFCAALLSPPVFRAARDYRPGDIAEANLKAPRDLSVEDVASTAQRQQEARASIDTVYDYDEEAVQLVGTQVAALFGALRQHYGPVWELESQVAALSKDPARAQAATTARQRLKEARAQASSKVPRAEQFLGREIEEAILAPMAQVRFSPQLEESIQRSVEQLLRPGVIGSLDDLPVDPDSSITVRRIPSGAETEEQDLGRFIDLQTARAQAPTVVREWMDWTRSANLQEATVKFVRAILRPNLAKNIQETEARREAAAKRVKPVYLNLKAGEVFVREGQRIDPEDLIILASLSSGEKRFSSWLAFGGTACALAVVFLLIYLFARKQLQFFRSETNDLLFYALLLALELTLVRLAPQPWRWGGYVAYGAMLVRLLLPAEVAFFHATVASLLSGFLVGDGALYASYNLFSSATVILLVSGYPHRLVLIRAGAVLGMINVAACWLSFYTHTDDLWALPGQTALILLGIGVAGPVAFVYLLSPLAERFFHYTSALRLMELNDTNHPLVKDLFFKAPGTYQHSLVIGMMAEAAAQAIGGDGLLLRVASLYHDIGKTKMPQYFIENMPDGGKDSPHNKLSPHMSAIIISSHVKDGIAMGREAGLPEHVIDMIPEHHGTKLMKYFWARAKEMQTPDMAPLQEADFRYPGPKPQSREGGIMLLADSTEAAVRTLPEFSEARIRGAVQKIVNDAFADGQLSECDLTLKDLNNIVKAFTRTLAAFHHHRIAYPEPAEKYRRKPADDGDTAAAGAAKPSGAEGDGGKSREENLRRLGS